MLKLNRPNASATSADDRPSRLPGAGAARLINKASRLLVGASFLSVVCCATLAAETAPETECRQDFELEKKLGSLIQVQTHQFAGVRISGNTAAVAGSIVRGDEQQRAVFIFEREGAEWVLRETLTRPTGEYDGGAFGFGSGLAISGDTIAVGDRAWVDPHEPVPQAVHIYVRGQNGWALQQSIHAPPPPNSVLGSWHNFADTVDLSGDTLVVGVSEAHMGGQWGGNEGTVFIYERHGTSWSQKQQLVPGRGMTAGEGFGNAVAIDGDTIVIGTKLNYYEHGSAYVFVRKQGAWTQQERFAPAGRKYLFGQSVAVSGDTIFVGEPNYSYDLGDNDSGVVRVYTRTDGTWQERQKLRPSDSRSYDNFGITLDVDGDLAVIGGVRYPTEGDPQPTGGAYVFERDDASWHEEKKLTGDRGDYFGLSVAISETRVIVGAPYNSENGPEAGAANIFKGQSVRMRLTVPEDISKLNEPFTAKIELRSRVPRPVTVTFDEPMLRSDNEEILAVGETDPTPAVNLTVENRSATLPVSVEPKKFGVAKLLTSAVVTDDLVTESICAEQTVIVRPLTVSAKVTPLQTVFNQTAANLKSDRCRELEANSPIVRDPETGEETREIGNCIEVTATVKNESEQPLANVTIANANDALRLFTSTDPKNPGVPLTLIESEIPAVAQLAPGAEAKWIWRMNAFDAPAALQFKAHASAVIDGTEVKNFARKDFKILKNVLLKWGMRPADGRTEYLSGQNVRAEGYIENFSKDSGEEKHLRVLVYQMPEENLGGGFVFKSSYAGPSPTQYEFFDLPADGAGKRLDVRSVFRSLRTEKASVGTAKFGIRVWIVEDDGTLRPATDQALLDSEYVDEFAVSFSPEPTPVDLYVQDCLNAGFAPILCSFNEGFAGEAVDGFIGLGKFALHALEQTGEGTVRTGAYAFWALREVMLATLGDEQAKAALMQDLYVQYLTFHQLGVLSGQVAGQAPMVFEAFVVQAGDSIGGFMMAVEKGDLTELQVQVGHFFGANPDMLLEPLVVARSFTTLAKGLSKASGGIADNVYTAAARQKGIRQQASVEARVAAAEADPNVTDLATALAAGDELKPNILRKVFGVSQATLKRIEDFAKHNEVILAFRSRHPLAQTLLDANLAWPKPQALKFKTVNEIDIQFLGYRRKAEATLEVVEPPAGIAGKEGAELEHACYLYMDVLTAKHPVLKQNKVLAAEVRDRLLTRAKEWNKYAPQLQLSQLDKKVHVGVNFGAGDQFVRDLSGDIGVKEHREIIRTAAGEITDPVTGQGRRVFELKMQGPNGAEARPIVGDIDFLGILDKHGRMIRDGDKRIALYAQLQEFLEHGESFTYREQKLREQFLECCTEPNGEAMMTVGPWQGGPRAGYFVNNLSVMDEFNAKFKRARSTEPQLNKAGEIERDANGSLLQVILRHEDPTGEYTLINGVPLLNHADKFFVTRFAPLIFEVLFEEFRQRIPFYFPSLISRLLGGSDDEGGNRLSRASTDNAVSDAPLFRRGGPILQAGGVSELDLVKPDTLRIWTMPSGWQPITRADAIAAGQPGVPDMAPNTSLSTNVKAGAFTLPLTGAPDLTYTGDFFDFADVVVLNPGGANQETAVIVSTNPLMLKTPLLYNHSAGEMVAVMDTLTDYDNDGLTNDEELALGTDRMKADTDGDGFLDGAEVRVGTNPLDASSTFRSRSLNLVANGAQLTVTWEPSVAGNVYVVEMSQTLTPNSWVKVAAHRALGGATESITIDNPALNLPRAFFRIRLGSEAEAP